MTGLHDHAPDRNRHGVSGAGGRTILVVVVDQIVIPPISAIGAVTPPIVHHIVTEIGILHPDRGGCVCADAGKSRIPSLGMRNQIVMEGTPLGAPDTTITMFLKIRSTLKMIGIVQRLRDDVPLQCHTVTPVDGQRLIAAPPNGTVIDDDVTSA